MLFHVYDGFIFPSEEWRNDIYYFTQNTGVNTKNACGHALITFLNKLQLFYSGSGEFDISSVCDKICYIYFHMRQKCVVPFKTGNSSTALCSAEQLDVGLRQVGRIIIVCIHCAQENKCIVFGTTEQLVYAPILEKYAL